MKAITKSNVISADDYKKMVLDVLRFSGKTVCRTLGPCANTSIIEEMGPLCATKDGFHTLQRIRFANEDLFANNIMSVIKTISHRMVSLAGDGSSSAVVAAWKFAERLNNLGEKYIRPRTLNDIFSNAVDNIIEKIKENSCKDISSQTMYDVAYISTNGDTEFAEMIKSIYEEYKNPVFSVIKSPIWGDKTKMEKISGYKADKYYMIDNIFHNRPGSFVGKNVFIICFDMAIDTYHYNMIHRIEQLAHQKDVNAEIIIVAPSYNQHFLDMVKRDVDTDLKLMQAKIKRHISIRYMRALCVNSNQRNNFMDFATLCGSNPITASDFNKMVDISTSEENFDDDILRASIGRVSEITTFRNEYTIINGFPEMDNERFGLIMQQVQSDYTRLSNENINRRVSSAAFNDIKNRLQKLEMNIVSVIVGAENEMEMELKFDAAEDATRACESVVRYGYNLGCNLAIIKACNELLETEDKYSVAYNVIADSFKDVFKEVLANKFTSDGYSSLTQTENIDLIIIECINKNKCYDLLNDKYVDNIINSSQTDIEILKGATKTCLTLMTANQYITQIPNNEE